MTARSSAGPASISVVIPVRDGERYLSAALASLTAQTRRPAQIIVVDDGSQDGSAALAASISAVTTVHSTPARGPAAARNLGARSAAGELLAFLDADDRLAAKGCEVLAAELERRGELDVAVGRVRWFASEDGPAVPVPREEPVGYLPGALLIRRAAFLRTGGLDEALQSGEFVDWVARARGELRFGEVDSVVLERRVHAANSSRDHTRLHAGYLAVARRAVLRSRK
jgi:glycosyltransferase involved in cell wall biosynthesis